jgi:Ice-binding-like
MLLLPLLTGGLVLTSFTEASVVSLGTAAVVAVLGGQTVTNTGHSVLNGDLDVSPGTAATGFLTVDSGPGNVNGAVHLGDAVAASALADARTAYGVLVGLTKTETVTTNLGGLTLFPGVYNFPSSGFLTGTLTLDAQGDAHALFVFQFGSTLITAPAAKVVIKNRAKACNVFWQVGSSATFDTTTVFIGNVLAHASITANAGATSKGGLYALNGAVTLEDNVVDSRRNCKNSL